MENNELKDKVQNTLDNIKNNKQNFIFLVPSATLISAEVFEIYNNAMVLSKNGYNVHMLLESVEEEIPTYIDANMKELPHSSIDKAKLMINPEDFIIIPEVLTNVMEKVKSLSCTKVLMLHSLDYALHSLIPGVNYTDFDIRDIIVTNDRLKERAKEIFGESFNYYQYKIGIPEYFDSKDILKRPVISFLSRNSNDITKVIKSFYLKYPHLRSFVFEDLNNLSRKQFAEKLKVNFCAVWIDRIAGFGTFPLECMKANVIPVGMVPDILQDYIVEDSGLWTNNIYNMPDLIASALSVFLEDVDVSKITDKMKEISNQYNVNDSEESILKIYNDLTKNKTEYIEKYLNNLLNKKTDSNE